MTGQTIAIIVGCVLAAFLLDWLLMLWLRRRKKQAPDGVVLGGQFSPVLTWLASFGKAGVRQRVKALPEVEPPETGVLPPNGDEPHQTPVQPVTPHPPDVGKLLRALRGWLAGLFVAPEGGQLYPHGAPSRRLVLIELALILVFVLAYCLPFLDLTANTNLPGIETESYQMLDQFMYDSLRLDGQFPLWNPYMFTGLPEVANPMFHAFNPVASVPVLLFGPNAGFKLAICLSFIIGALGMWWLCSIFGMGSVARVWMALIFAFAGQPLARFFQGEYLFVLGWAWLPWALAGLVAVFRTHRRLHAVIAAASLALVFFSGNMYYAFFIAFIGVIFLLAAVLQFRRKLPFIAMDRQRLGLIMVIFVLALGIAAAQLLPTYQIWNRISKSDGVVGSHSLTQIWFDFTSKDSFRPDAYTEYPAREEFYAYIGVLPFVPLALLPLVLVKRWRKDRRIIVFVFAMLAFSIMWIDMRDMPWAKMYNTVHIFNQFRHQVRMIIFTEMAVLLLAGMSVDLAWRWLWQLVRGRRAQIVRVLAGAGCVALVGLALVSSGDLYATNRQYTNSVPRYENAYAAFDWLRERVSGWTYVRHNPNNDAWLAGMVSRAPLLIPQYGFGDIRTEVMQPEGRRHIQAEPNYVLQSVESADEEGGVRMAEQFGYEFFFMPESLPFAFWVEDSVLDADPSLGEVNASEVSALQVAGDGLSSFEVIAQGSETTTLMLLVTDYPGWQLHVDGKKHALEGYNGYLSAEMLPGVHKYTFTFRPALIYFAFIISMLCVLLACWWLWQDARLHHQAQLAWLRRAPRAGWVWATTRPAALRAFFNGLRSRPPLEIDLLGLSITIQRRGGSKAAAIPADRTAVLARWLFVVALLVYAFTRLYALDKFPIYFFADEASNVLFAQQLIDNHFIDPQSGFLQVYFEASAFRWTPLFSVYPQALALTLFGKSVFVARATSALISLLSALSVSLMLKNVFKTRFWWLGALVMALIPSWFLHSRTAFETAIMTSFYSLFLLFYLLYRTKSPRYLFPALVLGAFAFYTYAGGQAIVGVTAIFLLLSDLRYHLKNWRVILPGLLVGGVLAIPLILFTINEPSGLSEHLRVLNSALTQAIPLQEKVLFVAKNYLYGISPEYWFLPNETDLQRHRMDSYGNIWTVMLPLFLLGLGLFLRKIKSAPHRAILLAGLAAPAGASVAEVGITRVMTFVIPAGLLIAFGIDWLMDRGRRWFPERAVALVVAFGLVVANFSMLNKALTEGPTWFTDYGLYGMQYGATQLFEDVIPRYLAADPNSVIYLNSTWANGADRFISFFVPDEQRARVTMEGIQTYIFRKMPLDDNVIFILPAGELKMARESNKFKNIDVLETVPYPDGTPGFDVAKMAYVDNIDQIFAAEKEERRKLVEDKATFNGRELIVRTSMLDMGPPQSLFDNDIHTPIRGMEANPLILEFDFPSDETFSSIYLDCGTLNMQLTVTVYPDGGEAETTVAHFDKLQVGATRVEVPLVGGSRATQKMRVEILATDIPEDSSANVHVFEFGWK